MQKLNDILDRFGITDRANIKLNNGLIIKAHKLRRAGFDESQDLYAIIFVIPYLTKSNGKNISAYAISRDYHLYFKELFNEAVPMLKEAYPNYSFAGFADDSPINERLAASIGGLGLLGNNGLIITEKYSSFVFIGEIITNMPLDTVAFDPKYCEGCGRCQRECPKSECGICLSALTQKKGELTSREQQAIKAHGSVWGCDICQEVCPHTEKAKIAGTIYTSIVFFEEKTLSHLSCEVIDAMKDEEFSERAYSWRGRDTVRRNILIFEDDD